MDRVSKRSGFTLVELLVVIGLIALLIGILLPVLAGVQARGRDVQCKSNIRQSLQLVLAYASENGGRLPLAYYWAPCGTTLEGWGPPNTPPNKQVTIWSILSSMCSKTYPVELIWAPPVGTHQMPGIMRCPEGTLVAYQLCTYTVNPVAFIVPEFDVRWNGATRGGSPHTRLVERQTLISKCRSITALIWDGAVSEQREVDYSIANNSLGVDVDDFRLGLGGARPQYRYYSEKDPFAQVPPGHYGNNKPVRMTVRLNRDGDGGFGILRFRHNRNMTCNVGFADGHVGQFTGRFTSEGKAISHDALRKHFMVKWPSGIGIGPDPDLPH